MPIAIVFPYANVFSVIGDRRRVALVRRHRVHAGFVGRAAGDGDVLRDGARLVDHVRRYEPSEEFRYRLAAVDGVGAGGQEDPVGFVGVGDRFRIVFFQRDNEILIRRFDRLARRDGIDRRFGRSPVAPLSAAGPERSGFAGCRAAQRGSRTGTGSLASRPTSSW